MTRTPIVGITHTPDLKNLIMQEIAEHGPAVDLNHIDVSKMGRMNFLFEDTGFVGDISRWNVSGMVIAQAMFRGCPFNGDISKWKPKNLIVAESMFEASAFNGDISKWAFKKLGHTTRMFYGSVFNGDISKWNVSTVDFAESMFEKSQFNGDISNWDTHAMKHMRFFFADSKFNGDISKWDMSRACQNDMHGMFLNAAFTGDLSNWKLSSYAAGIHRLFDEHFRGIPPTSEQEPTRNFYIAMFGTAAKLSAYLKSVPFNTAHFDLCFSTSGKPMSVEKKDHKWFKEIQQIGMGLGMSTEEVRSYAIAQYEGRNKPIDAPVSLGDLLIEPA